MSFLGLLSSRPNSLCSFSHFWHGLFSNPEKFAIILITFPSVPPSEIVGSDFSSHNPTGVWPKAKSSFPLLTYYNFVTISQNCPPKLLNYDILLRKKVSMIKISWESASYSIPLLEIHRAFSTFKPPKSWITLIHLSFPTCTRPSNPFPFMKLTNNLQNEYSTEYALESADPQTQPKIMLHFFVSQLPPQLTLSILEVDPNSLVSTQATCPLSNLEITRTCIEMYRVSLLALLGLAPYFVLTPTWVYLWRYFESIPTYMAAFWILDSLFKEFISACSLLIWTPWNASPYHFSVPRSHTLDAPLSIVAFANLCVHGWLCKHTLTTFSSQSELAL